MRWSQASLWLRLDKGTGASVTSPPHLTYAAARFHSASTPLMAQTQKAPRGEPARCNCEMNHGCGGWIWPLPDTGPRCREPRTSREPKRTELKAFSQDPTGIVTAHWGNGHPQSADQIAATRAWWTSLLQVLSAQCSRALAALRQSLSASSCRSTLIRAALRHSPRSRRSGSAVAKSRQLT